MSSKNDGFLPSILWPTNWKIHAATKIAADTGATAVPIACTATSASTVSASIVMRKAGERSRA
ncbi:hypothetical protein D3C72_1135230 [compost metagenome]